MQGNEHRENKEYMLEWFVCQPYNCYMRRFFNSYWDCRNYAEELSDHCSDIRAYKLDAEYENIKR